MACCSIIKLYVLRKSVNVSIRLGVGQESNVGPREEEMLTTEPRHLEEYGDDNTSTGQQSRQLRTFVLLRDEEPGIAVFLGWWQKSYDGPQECAAA